MSKRDDQTFEDDLASSDEYEPDEKQRPTSTAERWLRWLRGAFPGGAGFENTRYLTKWLFISAAIGVVAGLGAIAFYLAIEYATGFFLGGIVGYLPPSPVGEGSTVVTSMARPWLLPLVVALGGLISGLIVFNLAPEAEGHGTDAAIAAIHHRQGRIRPRIPIIKLVASAITIGSGGSGGREGPSAQISAGFGSLLGRWLDLDLQDRRIAVAAGMGAGIGAIFRAPLGGAMMAAELLYVQDIEVEAIIPALIASIIGYSVFGAVFGFTPIFGSQPGLALDTPIQLLYYAALGVLCGLGGLVYSKSFYGIAGVFHRFSLPNWLRPALGGLLVGLIGLVIPEVLHMGYGWVQISMGQELLGIPLWLVLVLPLAKILATSLSIGSGGSGGIFGPGMVIGGMIGASAWRIGTAILPNMPASPAPFVIVGMMATFGGVAHAPLAVMLMVAEMTGNLSLLAPAMIAVSISTALLGNTTIYRSQLPDRASSPAHRVRFSFPLLAALLVRGVMRPATTVFRPHETLADASDTLPSLSEGGAAVVDERRRLVGILTREELRLVPLDKRAGRTVATAMRRDYIPLQPSQGLDSALEQLTEERMTWAPVVEDERLIGYLTMADVVAAYKAAMQQSMRRISVMAPGVEIVEAQLSPSSPLANRTLREADLPRGALVLSVTRNGETLFPRASTRLAPGDVVAIMVDPSDEAELRRLLADSTLVV